LSVDAYKKAGIKLPLWLTDKKYSKNQVVTDCKNCKDTSFELLENKKETGKCCRCGLKYGSS